jgi:hypothetical protein
MECFLCVSAGIFMAVNKLEGIDVKNALLKVDHPSINLDLVNQLLKIVPTDEEEKALRRVGQIDQMSESDQFLLHVSQFSF